MASSIIHYAIACELIKRKQFSNPERLKLGSVLVDFGYNGNSHLKIPVAGGNKRTYDFTGYRTDFGELMKTDDMYLGYYLHLVQDIIYRNFLYNKYHWNPLIPGNTEKLHRDYAIGNYYVIQKYELENKLIIPEDFEKEEINRICAFNLTGLVQNMNSYFVPIEDDEIFFFTKEMTDEYIAEAVEYCIRELDNLENQRDGIDEYTEAWENAPRSILSGTMNTRDLGMYRIQGTEEYTVPNRIYRSDRYVLLGQQDDSAYQKDKELLKSRGIVTIIDLRSDAEAEAKPSAFADDSEFRYLRFPIAEGMQIPESLADVPTSYMEIAHADGMRDVFKTFANVQGGVLFHCTAGKDRTGVVSAILLMLAGISEEDIIYDYALSREYNKSRLEAFLSKHPEIDRDIVLANEKSMVGFLELFREKHNTAEQYLLDLGITESELKKIKDKLVNRQNTIG